MDSRRRHRTHWCLLIWTAMLVTGCRGPARAPLGPGETAPDAASAPTSAERIPIKDPETLVIVGSVPGSTFDPAANYETFTGGFLFNIYDTLIFFDGESTDRFIPWLATEVPSTDNGLIGDGGKTFSFPIRQGVTFHAGPVMGADGKPLPGSGVLTPEDVAYSFQRGMLADPLGGPQWLLLNPIVGVPTVLALARQIEEQKGGKKAADVETLDDVSQATRDAVCRTVKDAVQVEGDRVVFRLAEPYAPFLQVLLGAWGSILDKEWVAAAIPGESGPGKPGKKAGWNGDCATWYDHYGSKVEENELLRSTNGTGPYKLTRWVANDGWTLERHETFWNGPARIKKIIDIVGPDFTTQLLMYQNGDADFFDIPITNIDQVQPLIAKGALREIKGLPGRELWTASMNQKVDPNRNGFIGSGKLDGEGIPPDFFSDIDVRKGFQYAFDGDTFIRDRLNGDAIRATGPIPHGMLGFDPSWKAYPYDLDKAAEHFKKAFAGKLWDVGFSMVILAEPAIARPLQRDLAAVNPKFKISVESQAVDSFANTAADLIPFYTPSWNEDFHDPDDWVYPLLASSGLVGGPLDYDPTVQGQLDDLIIRARRELDPTERSALYGQIGRIAQDNALLIFTVEPIPRIYEPPYLQGVVHNPAYWGRYYWPMYKAYEDEAP